MCKKSDERLAPATKFQRDEKQKYGEKNSKQFLYSKFFTSFKNKLKESENFHCYATNMKRKKTFYFTKKIITFIIFTNS